MNITRYGRRFSVTIFINLAFNNKKTAAFYLRLMSTPDCMSYMLLLTTISYFMIYIAQVKIECWMADVNFIL